MLGRLITAQKAQGDLRELQSQESTQPTLNPLSPLSPSAVSLPMSLSRPSVRLHETRDGKGYFRGVKSFTCPQSNQKYTPARASDFDFPCVVLGCTESNRVCKQHS